ncbi:MAG: LysM peptidoglycan-binding domain-containing protein, partial [Planctomycetota bacterium]
RPNGANGGANPAGPTGSEPRRDEGTAAPGGTPRPEPKPAATPATPAAPARIAYLVRDKDTLESVARAKLGSAALWPEIVKLNPGLEPTRVRAGKEIWLPGPSAVAALQQPKPGPAIAPLADGRTYTVRKGDNYERIAVAQLGSKKRAQELMELNPTIEPTKLRPGHRLTLPAK